MKDWNNNITLVDNEVVLADCGVKGKIQSLNFDFNFVLSRVTTYNVCNKKSLPVLTIYLPSHLGMMMDSVPHCHIASGLNVDAGVN